MIKVIGKYSCSKCQDVVKVLTNREIEFNYSYIDELEDHIADMYKEKAKKADKVYYPIIVKDGEVVRFRDII